jgi:hypothetical protein
MTFIKPAVLCLVLAAFSIFSGCSKKQSTNWLIGEWEFDRDETTANLPPEAKTPTAANLVEQYLAQADDGSIAFTSTQTTFETPSGTGTSGYSILEEPDENTLVVQTDDGQARTFMRSGEFLIMASSRDVQFSTYFRRKN